jgi:hypothetical protein
VLFGRPLLDISHVLEPLGWLSIVVPDISRLLCYGDAAVPSHDTGQSRRAGILNTAKGETGKDDT